MPLPLLYKKVGLTVYSQGEMRPVSNFIVKDIPLTIFYNETELTTLVCSPGDHEVLAVGFLLSEGLVQNPTDIKEITFNDKKGMVWVKTHSPQSQTENYLRRHMAGCYGEERAALYFINDVNQLRTIQSTCKFTAPHLLYLISLLDEKSIAFRLTGGVHSAALADGTGMLVMYEDIGRHNAVDKVLGHVFLNWVNPEDKCLLLSGRVSSEILIKAARSGIPLVVSRSAPTQLAVELGEQLGIAVVGFARGQQLCVYSHAEKVVT